MEWKCLRCGSTRIEPEETGRTTLACRECRQRQRVDLQNLRLVPVNFKKKACKISGIR